MTVPSEENIVERLALIDQLKSFLVSAPNGQQDPIKQHVLSTSGESITCVKWNDAFYISGTDIVRCLVFRFHAFGRPIQNLKKFEEGVFSDLRNLKPGTDAILEEPKSAFLDLLFKNNCIRTQKKQKVFFWYSVPHDRLFLDALERDLKREKLGIYPTSVSVAHPAITISLDTTQAMFDNFRKSMLSEMNLDPFYLQREHSTCSDSSSNTSIISDSSIPPVSSREGDLQKASSAIFGQFSLFEGSPTYKQRRRRVTQQRIQQQQTPLVVDYNRKKISPTTHFSHPDTLNIWNSDASTSSNNNTDDDSTSVRSFNCPLSSCGKHFKRLEHMKRHLRTHTMERPYLCDLCGKRFSRSDNLAQHKKTHQRIRTSKHGNHDGSDGDDRPSSCSDSSEDKKRINSQFNAKSSSRRRGSSNNNKSYSRSVKHHSSAKRTNMQNINTPSRRHLNSPRNKRHSKSNALDTELMYESDWSHSHQPAVEYLKAEPVYPQLVVPELSISTTSSSAASSCDSSPIYTTRPPTIKIEDTEIFYDLSSQPLNDTNMMMVEELLPQQNPYWEDESASDWQRRVDWNQYCAPVTRPYDLEDFSQFYPHLPTNNYLHHQLYPSFVDHSTVTTAANSPILGASEFYPPHYFSQSPTMTPNDALLQH
ncbi:STE like transcription factor-domain-containing protein [Thamnidium elegans]|nr:STE like transcription factor-domain-containing protein [Thamnidium elegans]